MELSINALADRAEEFLSRLASARATPDDEDGDPERRRDTFFRVRELAQSPKTDADTKAAAQRLLRHLAWAHRHHCAEVGRTGVAAALAAPIVSSGKELPLAEALRRLAEDPVRDRRHALERDAAEALWERQTAWAQLLDASVAADTQLQLPPAGASLQPWLEAAEALLAKTEDAYRDLLGYALRRVDPQLKPRAARWHDLLHAVTAPWMTPLFGASDLLPAATRTFEELGLQPARVAVETGDATLVRAVRVPGDVRLSVRRRDGLDACVGLLEAFGEAQLWAHAPGDVPPIDRRFTAPAHVEATRALTGHFCLEEGWLKRFLKLPSAGAREAARLGALRALTGLRQAAALLPYALELQARGPVRALADEFEDRLGRALLVGVPKGLYLQAVDGVEPTVLFGASLEIALGEALRERFNEDYFRNPATGTWFKERAARIGVDSSLAAAPNLARVGQRLVRLMGA